MCGGAIDYSLPARHPLSYEVDEIIPVSRGGSPYDLTNTGPAHRRCNQWKGSMTLEEARAKLARMRRATPAVTGSGKWE